MNMSLSNDCFSLQIDSLIIIHLETNRHLIRHIQLHLHFHPVTGNKCLFKHFQLQSACVSPNLLYFVLQWQHQTCSILASKCISKFPYSWHSFLSPMSVENIIYVHSTTASKNISLLTKNCPHRDIPKFSQSGHPGKSLSFQYHDLPDSVSNGSGPPLRVLVQVRTEPLPRGKSGWSIHPNRHLG